MEAILIGIFLWIVVSLAERQNSILRDQPCKVCGKTIHWVELPVGWVHAYSGQPYEPYTLDEWMARMRAADNPRDVEMPHGAQRAWSAELAG